MDWFNREKVKSLEEDINRYKAKLKVAEETISYYRDGSGDCLNGDWCKACEFGFTVYPIFGAEFTVCIREDMVPCESFERKKQ